MFACASCKQFIALASTPTHNCGGPSPPSAKSTEVGYMLKTAMMGYNLFYRWKLKNKTSSGVFKEAW
eukprot:5191691-Karenia_brevis.AAC.1